MKYESYETRIARLADHVRRRPSDRQAISKLLKLQAEANKYQKSTLGTLAQIYKRLYSDVNCPPNRMYAASGGFFSAIKFEQ